MVEETIPRPNGLTDEHLEYLDDLRESGVTNMFGAGQYLMDTFGLPRDMSTKYLVYWMEFKRQSKGKKDA